MAKLETYVKIGNKKQQKLYEEFEFFKCYSFIWIINSSSMFSLQLAVKIVYDSTSDFQRLYTGEYVQMKSILCALNLIN